MSRYGWVVAVERAPYLEDGKELERFTVNLVRPWSDGEGQNDFRGPLITKASDKVGTLWSPWNWKGDTGWAVYGRYRHAGKPVWIRIKKAEVKPLEESMQFASRKGFIDAIDKEIAVATENTEYPFSRLLDDLQTKGTRSHVHMLAPLTHWPARLSGGVLQLTWLMTCPQNDMAECEAVACFPEFEMAPGDEVRKAQQRPNDDSLKDFTDIPGKPGVTANYGDEAVRFLSLAAEISDDSALVPVGDLEMSQGRVSRSALIAFYANNLLPLPVLSAWIAQASAPSALADFKVRTALVRALWMALGFGLEYEGGTQGRPNIVEFLAEKGPSDARVLRKAIGQNIGQITDGIALTAFTSSIEKLVLAGVSNAWTVEQRSRWKQLVEALNFLTPAQPALEAEAFRTEWLQVAGVLASEDGMREIMGVWLEKVLDGLFVDAAGKAAWAPVRDKLGRVGEFRRDLLLRAQPFLGSVSQWDLAREVAQKPGDAASIAELNKRTAETVIAALGGGVTLPANELEAAVTAKVTRFLQEMTDASDSSRSRPRDRGLRLDFSGWDAGSGKGSDHRLRGYAIGLCAGIDVGDGNPWLPDTKRARWLTDTAVRVNQAWADNDDADDSAVPPKRATVAWMHEAVGATLANGEKLVSVEYEGAPVATALAEGGKIEYDGEDPDGFTAIDFAWNEADRSLPLLGYGLHYAAIATPLDNVGIVIDQNLRGPVETELKKAEDVLARPASTIQYWSSEVPGAPGCTERPAALYELSDETQAHAWQLREIARTSESAAAASKDSKAAKVRVPTLGKVALLAAMETVEGEVKGQQIVLFPQAAAECKFDVAAPGTHSAFIERWLATDRLLVEKGMAPSDPDLGSNPDIILAFAREFRERTGPRATSMAAYHPAVSAIGVQLVVGGKEVEARSILIDRVRGQLEAAEDKVSVKVSATIANLDFIVSGKSVTLSLPRGTFACLRFYSLVDERHFKPGSSDHRYAAGLNNTTGVSFAGYRAFSPTELWFEAIPAWPKDGLPADKVRLLLDAPSESEGRLLSPNLVVAALQFETAPKWAHWIKGAYLQRHEWHWTGYPIDFPGAKSELPTWVSSLAGVESFRETIESDFTTSFDGTGWRIGPDRSGRAVAHRWALAAGARPARYVAYLARPTLRFRRWLNRDLGASGPLAVEREHLYAAGSLVQGRPRDGVFERLATPALRHGIPLTAAYSPGDAPTRGQNGVMLVFDEAIRRTDDLAQVGGLGDTLEIDLVDTRIAGVSEIGNNPIFHGRAPQSPDAGLQADRPFGLTFDIGPNPKVVQTAIVVRPVNSGGRWVMAMARARRFILPETELGTGLRTDPVRKKDAPLQHHAVVPTRLEGKDLVPIDFVVDVKVPLEGNLRLVRDDGGPGLTVAVPKMAKPDATLDYRYLVSWHKARWHSKDDTDSEARWRCQVILQTQRRDGKRIAWDTLPGTVRCSQNAGSQLASDLAVERWLLESEAAVEAAQVRRIRISDYTDPRWLTFIGSFGNEVPGMASDYRFVVSNGKLDRLEVLPGRKATLPQLNGRNTSLANVQQPTFHLALIFRELPDAVRMRTEKGTGELVACYFVDSHTKPVHLPHVDKDDPPPTSLKNCHAHILTLQRTTSLSQDEKNLLEGAKTLPELLDYAFPAQGNTAKESTLRFVPEYIGPIPIYMTT
jgi:hypothetical protein